MTREILARWRSVVVGVVGVAAVVAVALWAPESGRGEAYTAIGGIVSVIAIRHAGQDRDKAAP